MGATWIFRGDQSRRRRGCHVDSPWRPVAATPRVPRGSSEATTSGRGSRGEVNGTCRLDSWMFRGTRRGDPAAATRKFSRDRQASRAAAAATRATRAASSARASAARRARSRRRACPAAPSGRRDARGSRLRQALGKESRRRHGDDVDGPWMGRGDAAATTRIFRGGCRGDAEAATWMIRGRVAAAPRRRRGWSVDGSRRRRGYKVDRPQTGRGDAAT